MRLTENQRRSLVWLGRLGDSGKLSRFMSVGIASLERRGLVENVGGRGRHAKHVLTAAGREALDRVNSFEA